ncbi:hypothetical protein [Bacteriovorax sp. BSW11_IV]|uniref:hypothetical protein n=1 Tax=Bacteriovorax sp. BSW11_IV TaxID=1353529 RepID=UPI0003FBCAFA|nr:hypothetical protein [Bacteriovorax sp. BSW11_IV]
MKKAIALSLFIGMFTLIGNTHADNSSGVTAGGAVDETCEAVMDTLRAGGKSVPNPQQGSSDTSVQDAAGRPGTQGSGN